MKINLQQSIKIILYAAGISFFVWLLTMPINNIRVNDSSNNVAASEVAAKISPMLKYGWFYTNLDNMAQEIQQIPWVDAVNIVRLSPLELEINIVEKTPIARWNSNSLVSDKGNIFSIGNNSAFKKLPLLEAELTDANDTITTYFALTQYLSLPSNKALKGLKAIRCGDSYGCRITFGNKLLLKIGAENIAAKLQRFFHFLPKIVAKNRHKMPSSIDMRYANGAAVA